jgi:tetratricopeptide (TPR) repeat protein/predicted Ser/Thr protein kinase
VPCPEPDVLERYASGELDERSRRALDEHVSSCEGCREQLADVTDNLHVAGSVRQALDRIEKEESVAPAPERIGPFRILGELGHGGMGVVYLAEQDKPRRQVALKVLHPGHRSATALRRFEHEANLLAQLQHPGIAQVFEAGVAAGQPYLVMEHVRGERLDEYVERRSLSAREKLALVAEVCDAAHHAHVRGVVHRDLKPGNILVEEAGADDAAPGRPPLPRTKVLDFGVARATDADLQTMTLRTEAGQLLGTIPFMSPEQLLGDSSKVDARSDVYSLGVVAHWLLAGDFPYPLRDKSIVEAARLIQERAPTPLSSIDVRHRGDVETIVAKALEKDPARRYQSASELAADLRRHLADEPIMARPPGAADQLRRFARRHRALASMAAAGAAVLGVAAVGGSWLAVRATRAERAARSQLARAESIQAFLEGMLSAANPYESAGDRPATVEDVLDGAASELDAGRLRGQQSVEGAVRLTLGNTYWALARYDAAERQFRAALDVFGSERSRDGVEGVVRTMGDLGMLLSERSRYAEAESTFRRQYELAHEGLGDANAKTVQALGNLAGVLADQRKLAEAESLLVRALALSRRLTGDDVDIHRSNLHTLGGLRLFRGDLDGAEAALREALAISRARWGPKHPSSLATLEALTVVLGRKGDVEEERRLLEETLKLVKEAFGDEHPRVADATNNLATAMAHAGELAGAETLLRRAVDMNRRLAGRDHRETARSLNDLAQVLVQQGRLAEAEPLFRESLEINERVLGAESVHVATVASNLARLLRAQKRFADAEPLYVRSLEILRKQLGDDHATTRAAAAELAALREEAGGMPPAGPGR